MQSLEDNRKELIKIKKEISEVEMEKALRVVTKMAAITTGALEGLYEANRGITFTIAKETTILSAEVADKYEDMKKYFESQLKTYDMIIDFATNSTPINEAYLREIHKAVCEPQKSYNAYTFSDGKRLSIQKDLHHGQYKDQPNHVMTTDNTIHSYAPVHETKPEMDRFVRELNSIDFKNAHPINQASYAHYAIVSIHPFSDGNGRVARILSSIFTYKSYYVPFLIFVEDKEDYYSTLSVADKHNYEPFIKFTYDRVNQALKLVIEIFRVSQKSIGEHITELEDLYTTKGGYSHSQVDDAGYELLNLIAVKIIEKLKEYRKSKVIIIKTVTLKNDYEVNSNKMRCPISNHGQIFKVSAETPPPANAKLTLELRLEVPMDAKQDDYILIKETQYNNSFKAQMSELIPKFTTVLTYQIDLYVEKIIRLLLHKLKQSAEISLTESGIET